MALMLNTAALVVAVLALAAPCGAALALLLWRTDVPSRTIARGLLVSLPFVPLYVQAAAWQAGFGLQGWQSLATGAAPWLTGFWGAAWVHALAAIPWIAVLTAMGLKQVEPALEESALLELPPLAVLGRVSLRRAAPYLLAAAALTATVVAGEMTVTDLFQVRTFAERLYIELAIGGEPGDAPRLALPGTLLTLAGFALVALAARRLSPAVRSTAAAREVTFALGPTRWLCGAAVWLALAVLVVAPAVQLAHQAGIEVVERDGARMRTWSAVRCLTVVAESPGRFRRELGWSTQLGVLSASGATALAVVLAWWSRRGGVRAAIVLILAALSLSVPGPVVGLTLVRLFDRPELPWLTFLYDQSLAAPLAALVFRTFGLATLMIRAALVRVPQVLWEASTLDGVVGWRQLALVGLPAARRPIAAAWLAALALAVGELSATILTLPPRVTTLAVRIATLSHYGVEDRLAGICLAVWLMSAALGLLAAAAWRDEE